MTELLSPAGNFEKLRAAIRYGADAVYLAGQRFGMRSAADNFGEDELPAAVQYAHERGKKLYLTVNTMPHGNEYPALRAYLSSLSGVPVDGMIVTDLGVFATIRELLPEMPIHISTQSSIVSPAAAKAWAALGATRLVLARELTLDEVRAIRETPPWSWKRLCTAPCAYRTAAGACSPIILRAGMPTAAPAPSPAGGITPTPSRRKKDRNPP